MYRCLIRDKDGKKLDDAMICEMHGPNSYTGENVVELYLHGSPFISSRIIAECNERGARLADPGEFTQRAFLNGRMSLEQAEAVVEVIAACNEEETTSALHRLGGALSEQILGWVEALETVLSEWVAAVDFTEHDTGAGYNPGHLDTISNIMEKIQVYLERSVIRDGKSRSVVLAGGTNVGKSTLLNVWSGEKRALVDPNPGTTRDSLEVELQDGARRWKVWDTAGHRQEADGIEAEGIELGLQRARDADLVVWLIDPSDPTWPPGALSCLVVGSKSDAVSMASREIFAKQVENRSLKLWGWISSRSSEGVDALRQIASGQTGQLSGTGMHGIRHRHAEAMRRATAQLSEVFDGQGKMTLDVMMLGVEAAVRSLGSILGRDVDSEVLDRIFSEFCVGK
jgi:tRNA modification GTPase